MTQSVPQDLQLSLLEFIADLQGENYERVPDDLVQLGFVPADAIEELRSSGLTYGITEMLKLAGKGGGPKGAMEAMVEQNKEKYGEDLMREFGTLDSPEAVKERQRRFREDYRNNMAMDAMSRTDGSGAPAGGGASTTMDLTQKIEQLQQENSNVFAIPDYFVYMSRAFATLEGIGLSSDPKYSILNECFPYLAKRLLSDDSPRARGALRTLLYGTGDELDLSKLQDVTKGLESYTVSTASVASSTGASDEGRSAAATQLADVVLSEEGNFVQSLLLREAAVALDATVRDRLLAAAEPLRQPLSRLPPLPTPLSPGANPLLAPLALPLLPLEIARASLELADADDKDARRLKNLQILAQLAGGGGAGAAGGSQQADALSGAEGEAAESAPGALVRGGGGGGGAGLQLPKPEQARALANEAAARRDALARIGVRFGGSLATEQAKRLRERSASMGDGASPPLSELAGRLAEVGAGGLEDIAQRIDTLDRELSTGTSSAPREGTTFV